MVKVKGSKDGTRITARFEGASKSLVPSLKKTKALILLSIKGNPYCVGTYLQAIINKACSDFEFITFLIADEVHWNNLISDTEALGSDSLRQQAHALGQQYFEEHLEYFVTPLGLNMNEFDSALVQHLPLDKQATLNTLAQRHSNFEVVFWRDWLNKSPKFLAKSSSIAALYETHDTLKASIEETAADFARRHTNERESYELLLRRSRGYLVEESPAVMWVAAALGYHFVVYPGEMIKPFKETKALFINPPDASQHFDLEVVCDTPHLMANWLEVSFQRSHDKKTINQKHHQSEELTALMKGVTEGIFGLDLEDEDKIRFITDVLFNYHSRKERGRTTQNTLDSPFNVQ